MSAFNTHAEPADAIPDEDAAGAHSAAIRWKNGAFCPYCAGSKVYGFADRKTHKCAAKGRVPSQRPSEIESGVPCRRARAVAAAPRWRRSGGMTAASPFFNEPRLSHGL